MHKHSSVFWAQHPHERFLICKTLDLSLNSRSHASYCLKMILSQLDGSDHFYSLLLLVLYLFIYTVEDVQAMVPCCLCITRRSRMLEQVCRLCHKSVYINIETPLFKRCNYMDCNYFIPSQMTESYCSLWHELQLQLTPIILPFKVTF